MNNDEKTPVLVKQIIKEKRNKIRKTYKTPRLDCLGDLRDLTLGPSIGLNDSQNFDPNSTWQP